MDVSSECCGAPLDDDDRCLACRLRMSFLATGGYGNPEKGSEEGDYYE